MNGANRVFSFLPSARVARNQVMMVYLLLMLSIISSLVHAQSSSMNFRLAAGTIVAGGGASTSATRSVAGMVPLATVGSTASSSRYCFSGIGGAVFSAIPTDLRRPSPVPGSSYRIIGLPVSPAGPNTIDAVFVDDFGAYDKAVWRLGSYDAALDSPFVAEYPAAAAVTPGQAYWLIVKNAASYGEVGYTHLPTSRVGNINYFDITLDDGWNMVTNPLPYNVAWDDVLFTVNGAVVAHSSGDIEDAAYSYNGTSYVDLAAASYVPAWDGFFVYVPTTANVIGLKFPFTEATLAPLKSPVDVAQKPSLDNWRINLRLLFGHAADDNFAGVTADAADGEDRYDLSEPPPPPDAPFAAFRLPDGDSRLRRCDFRSPFGDGAEWTLVLSAAPGRILTAAGIDQIPDDMQAVLRLDNGSKVALREGTRLALADNVNSATLIVGTREYLTGQQSAQPASYALYQNFPNPFNPSTTISFDMPTAGRVRLVVYNILGQRVKMMVDEDRPAGQYVESWDGQDNQGRSVASGVYFYRLQAGNFTQSRKMSLLK